MSADLDSTTTPDYITDIRPRYPWIKVLFHGLMTGCFNRENTSYEVGLLRRASHTIQLNVWEPQGKNPQQFNENSKQAILKINHRDSRNNKVKRFQPRANFDRLVDPGTSNVIRHDFRWILDFERDDMHGQDDVSQGGGRRPLTKIPNKLKPKFRLENGGVLFTLVRAIPILKQRQGQALYLGRIAQIMAAYIDPPDYPVGMPPAELTIDGGKPYRFDINKKYEIVLRNDCESSEAANVIDTTYLRDAFQRTSKGHFDLLPGLDNEQAKIMMAEELANGIAGECGSELGGLFDFLKERKIRASRYNPCGKAFYGQSTSLD